MHPMKTSICLLFCILLMTGCASRQDLKQVRQELDLRASAQANDIERLKQENAVLRKVLENNQEAVAVLRKTQAEYNADTVELKDRIRLLSGQTEELRKDLTALSRTAQSRDEEIMEKLDRISFKISFVENFLGVGKKDAAAEGLEKGSRLPNGRQKDAPNGKTQRESLYTAAYEAFREGKYEKAAAEFQNFLKLHPGTEYSGNAQFWLAECYYNEQKYETAILEYEKVVKNYPEGNKVPYALLKQGISFQQLGDKTSARMILQQIIRDYPNTNQARVARTQLLEIQ